jgi:hypothetical protein
MTVSAFEMAMPIAALTTKDTVNDLNNEPFSFQKYAELI